MELFILTLAFLSKTYYLDVDPWPAVKVKIQDIIMLKFCLDSFMDQGLLDLDLK